MNLDIIILIKLPKNVFLLEIPNRVTHNLIMLNLSNTLLKLIYVYY